MEVFLITMRDPSYWSQILAASAFIYTVLCFGKQDLKRPFPALGKFAAILTAQLVLHFVLCILTERFRFLAGVGTWISVLGGVLMAYCFCRFERSARNVCAAVCFATILTVFELGATLGRTLEYYFEGFDSIWMKLLSNLLILVLGIVLNRHPVSKYYVSKNAAILNITASTLAGIAVISYDLMMINVFERGGNYGDHLLMSVTLTVMYVTILVTYLMTYALSREQTHGLRLQAEAEINKASEQLMTVSQHNLEELRNLRHDINNQYSYMRILLNEGKIDELNEYFGELLGTFSDNIVQFIDCGNPVLNTILNMENAKAKEAGVSLDVKVAVPSELPFSNLDLCKLITNVIDNAIEACVSEEIDDAVIAVQITVNDQYFLMSVTNPTKKPTEFTESLHTTKKDSLQHGMGTRIIRETVKKYDGAITQKIADGRWRTELMIAMKGAWSEHE